MRELSVENAEKMCENTMMRENADRGILPIASHINSPPATALQRVQERTTMGGRGKSPWEVSFVLSLSGGGQRPGGGRVWRRFMKRSRRLLGLRTGGAGEMGKRGGLDAHQSRGN